LAGMASGNSSSEARVKSSFIGNFRNWLSVAFIWSVRKPGRIPMSDFVCPYSNRTFLRFFISVFFKVRKFQNENAIFFIFSKKVTTGSFFF